MEESMGIEECTGKAHAIGGMEDACGRGSTEEGSETIDFPLDPLDLYITTDLFIDIKTGMYNETMSVLAIHADYVKLVQIHQKHIYVSLDPSAI